MKGLLSSLTAVTVGAMLTVSSRPAGAISFSGGSDYKPDIASQRGFTRSACRDEETDDGVGRHGLPGRSAGPGPVVLGTAAGR